MTKVLSTTLDPRLAKISSAYTLALGQLKMERPNCAFIRQQLVHDTRALSELGHDDRDRLYGPQSGVTMASARATRKTIASGILHLEALPPDPFSLRQHVERMLMMAIPNADRHLERHVYYA